MTKTKIADGIFLLRFPTQYELACSFLRVQEHYESSRFRNRVFSLEDYMDWYASKCGAFTYFEDWSGFNVPSSAFQAFKDGQFDPLMKKEARLLRQFRSTSEPFYVIGVASDRDLKHELAHAMFFTRPDYKRAVLAAMGDYDTSALEGKLARMGYHRQVLRDEAHAYLVAPAGSLGRSRALAPLRRELQAIYRRYAVELSPQ
jgi:hypothetical protein